MLLSFKELKNYSIMATDGKVGTINDLYFNDNIWLTRYFVISTGPFFLGKFIMIPPHQLDELNWTHKEVEIDLTKDVIKNSPDIDLEKPVSRQQEMNIFEYYNWSPYWNWPIYVSQGVATPNPLIYAKQTQFHDKVDPIKEDENVNPNLRSANEVIGYHIEGKDTNIGKVKDFIVDDRDWGVRYIIADTGTLVHSKKVMLLPVWVDSIIWSKQSIKVHFDKAALENSPEYNEEELISGSVERSIKKNFSK